MTKDLVAAHNNEVVRLYGAENVFATMLYGSQNYNLSTPDSDIDSKVMILPTLEAAILNRKMVSTEHIIDSGIANVKDVRAMFDNFLKSNINFLEILFTSHRIINPTFKSFWDELYNSRHEVANASPRRLMHAAAGMAQQKCVAMQRPFESKLEVLAKYGYDPKQLHHLCRLKMFMKDYLEYQSFAACLVPQGTNHDYLLSLKTNPPSLEEAIILKEQTMDQVNELLSVANETFEENPSTYTEVKDFLDDLVYRLIYTHFVSKFMPLG